MNFGVALLVALPVLGLFNLAATSPRVAAFFDGARRVVGLSVPASTFVAFAAILLILPHALIVPKRRYLLRPVFIVAPQLEFI